MIHFTHMRRRHLFALADAASVFVAVWAAYFIRTHIPLPLFQGLLPIEATVGGFQSLFLPVAALAALFAAVQYAFGIYDLWHTASSTIWAQRLIPANAAMVAAAFSYLYLTKNFDFPRSLLFAVFVTNLLMTLFWRVIYFNTTSKQKSDVVLVGKWTDVERIVAELEEHPFKGHISIKALFLPSGCSERVPDGIQYPVLPFSKFDDYSKKYPYASVILAPSESMQHQTFTQVLAAAQRGVCIYAIPNIYEILLGRLQHLRINDLPLLELRLNPPSDISLAMKRIFDLTLASALLFLLGLPMLAIALFVKLSSPGAAIYSQVRVGQNGREFRIYKFRTMCADAERQTGAVLATIGDPRITKLGRFMRATRLDELPQLWNILLGDMSFVGPRPERPNFVRQFEQSVPGYTERHRVRPGVTGLAQVSGGYVSLPETKLKYDLAYIANQNILFDTQIILRTVKTVLTRAGM